MSRHTLNDGVTHDSTISDSMYDVWWPELAPQSRLLGDYYKRNLPWQDFDERFNSHLDTEHIKAKIAHLALLAIEGDATILCTEATPELCHRRLIIERVQLLFPEISTEIN